MVNYTNADVAAMRAAAAARLKQDLARGTQVIGGKTVPIGKGYSNIGNIAGFDIDAYKKAVEGGASGSALRDAAAAAAGQKQIYRTQPEVQRLITELSKKNDDPTRDVTSLALSSVHSDAPVQISSPRQAREAILATTDQADQTKILQELRPISAEGVINDRIPSLAPIAHPTYETQGHDDLVSNMYASTATPDEADQFDTTDDSVLYDEPIDEVDY